jgi:outer membrane protein TolC
MLLLIGPIAYAQDSTGLLTLEEAVVHALEENQDITVARNEAEIENNNATAGNAGLFPSLTIEGNYTENLNDTYIEFAGGERPPIDRKGARSTQYGASVNLNYNLFGGLEKYYRLESLQNLGRTGDVQARLTVENTILQTLNTYFEAARLTRQVDILQAAVALSLERLRRMEAKYEFGAVTKLEVLNAQVDLNSDSIELAQTATNLDNAKRNLMVLIGAFPRANYQVETDFVLNKDLELEEVLPEAMDHNANLVLAELRRQNAEINTLVTKSGNYPDLNLTASYGYNRVENQASFFTFQEELGFTGGVNLNYPIINGGRQNLQVQNAEISLENNQARMQQARLQVRKNVMNAYATYRNNLFLLKLAGDDVQTAVLNFERSQEAYQTGQINSTEFRNAQLNLIRAQNRISDLRIQSKGSEVQLFQLSGQLLQEVN